MRLAKLSYDQSKVRARLVPHRGGGMSALLPATIEADYRNNQAIEGQCASLGGHPMGRALTGTDAVHATSHTSSRHQMRRCHAE